MAVPDFQSLTLPLLRIAGDGKEHSLSEARGHLAAEFKLTQAEELRRPKREAQEPLAPEAPEAPDAETPEEALEAAHARMEASLASEVLARVEAGSPAFFEGLVVELLLKMGSDEAGASDRASQVDPRVGRLKGSDLWPSRTSWRASEATTRPRSTL